MLRQFKNFLKKLINLPLNLVGLSLVKQSSAVGTPSWVERIRLAKQLGFSPNSILDGGAFKGIWTKEIATIFPNASIMLVEPNPFLIEDIRSNTSHIRPLPNIQSVAIGDVQGTARLNIWHGDQLDTGASLLNHVQGGASTVVDVEVDTLDNLALKADQLPDLVKLDLQGAELMALRGAIKVLKHAEMMVIEFGCLEAYEHRSTPDDLMRIMYRNNYCLYDIVDCHYRPFDGALTGGDFIFVKNDSVLRKHKGWE